MILLSFTATCTLTGFSNKLSPSYSLPPLTFKGKKVASWNLTGLFCWLALSGRGRADGRRRRKTGRVTRAPRTRFPPPLESPTTLPDSALQLHGPASCFSSLTRAFLTWGPSNCSSLCLTIQESPNQTSPTPHTHIRHLLPAQPPLLPKIKCTGVFAHLLSSPCISSKCPTRVQASILPRSPVSPEERVAQKHALSTSLQKEWVNEWTSFPI